MVDGRSQRLVRLLRFVLPVNSSLLDVAEKCLLMILVLFKFLLGYLVLPLAIVCAILLVYCLQLPVAFDGDAVLVIEILREGFLALGIGEYVHSLLLVRIAPCLLDSFLISLLPLLAHLSLILLRQSFGFLLLALRLLSFLLHLLRILVVARSAEASIQSWNHHAAASISATSFLDYDLVVFSPDPLVLFQIISDVFYFIINYGQFFL